MERLTIRTPQGAALNMADEYENDAEARKDLMRRYLVAVERLAAYEDTGLEPEAVTVMKYSMMGKAVAEIKEFDGVPVNRLRELALADKDGRLVVLPCKVGDTLWANFGVKGDYLRTKDRPYSCKVRFIGLSKGPFINIEFENGRIFPVDFSKIGKTIFLTREEAEAALGGAK